MARRSAHDPAPATTVRRAARAGDIDRYLAALLAPRAAQAGLLALAAFFGEVARIPGLVNEPMMGEIRLQWWRDAIAAGPDDGPTGNPIADALRATIGRHELPEALFDSFLEAHSRDLVPHPFEAGQSVEGYLDATEGNAFRLAALILGAGTDAAAEGTLQAAGQAYGRVRILRGLPATIAKGRALPPQADGPGQDATDWVEAASPLIAGARTWLTEMRRRAASAPGAVNAAILPVALVEPYLTALEGLGPDLATMTAEISPLTRVWRLWWASSRGHI
jgi:15-cis-phytoene synthase